MVPRVICPSPAASPSQPAATTISQLEFFKLDRVNGTPLAEFDEGNRCQGIYFAKLPGVTSADDSSARVFLVRLFAKYNEATHRLLDRPRSPTRASSALLCTRHRWVVCGHYGVHAKLQSASPLLSAAVEGPVCYIRVVDHGGSKLQAFAASNRPSEGAGGCRLVNPGKPIRPVDGVH